MVQILFFLYKAKTKSVSELQGLFSNLRRKRAYTRFTITEQNSSDLPIITMQNWHWWSFHVFVQAHRVSSIKFQYLIVKLYSFIKIINLVKLITPSEPIHQMSLLLILRGNLSRQRCLLLQTIDSYSFVTMSQFCDSSDSKKKINIPRFIAKMRVWMLF